MDRNQKDNQGSKTEPTSQPKGREGGNIVSLPSAARLSDPSSPKIPTAEKSPEKSLVAPVKTQNVKPESSKPDEMTDYLNNHPEFLSQFLPNYIEKNPDFLQKLRPPTRAHNPDIVDFRQFLIEKLQNDLVDLRVVQRKMIAVARHNLAGQNRVHQAILTLMRAQSFEQFIALVTEDLAMMLDVDAVALCIEDSRAATPPAPPHNSKKTLHLHVVGENHVPPASATRSHAFSQPASALISGVHILPPGTIQQIVGHSKVLLRADIGQEDREGYPSGADDISTLIYGHKAVGLVRSDALARLDFNLAAADHPEPQSGQKSAQNRADMPVIGLLALGARRPGVYHSGQSTELVHFLAEFIVANVQRWLSLPVSPNA